MALGAARRRTPSATCDPESPRYAFPDPDLNRIYTDHMVRNPTSGRVLASSGFHLGGLLRQRVRKWGLYEDVVLQALLRSDRSEGIGPSG
jgi:RimJ/RimL family protein N-acetyltransferase